MGFQLCKSCCLPFPIQATCVVTACEGGACRWTVTELHSKLVWNGTDWDKSFFLHFHTRINFLCGRPWGMWKTLLFKGFTRAKTHFGVFPLTYISSTLACVWPLPGKVPFLCIHTALFGSLQSQSPHHGGSPPARGSHVADPAPLTSLTIFSE